MESTCSFSGVDWNDRRPCAEVRSAGTLLGFFSANNQQNRFLSLHLLPVMYLFFFNYCFDNPQIHGDYDLSFLEDQLLFFEILISMLFANHSQVEQVNPKVRLIQCFGIIHVVSLFPPIPKFPSQSLALFCIFFFGRFMWIAMCFIITWCTMLVAWESSFNCFFRQPLFQMEVLMIVILDWV